MNKTSFGLPKKREEVIGLLQKAYTDNDLEETEYEDRLQKAYEASCLEDLEKVIHDFPNRHTVFATQSAPHFSAPKTAARNANLPDTKTPQHMTAILGEQKLNVRKSYFTPLNVLTVLGEHRLNCQDMVPKANLIPFSVKTVLGDTRIDLRNPQFHGKTIHIAITNLLGETKILVPKGAVIQNMTNTILGDYSEKHKNNSNLIKKIYKSITNEPEIPQEELQGVEFTVVLRGTCLLGNVSVAYY
ncbi:uncharacterized protein DUF1707 [Sediminitomix flava]|uniref:Uncharacterized protein DUF1707 n=2 Tax=Sediminitomix flava TaxID=379075 RepID=A0A315Z0M7_SEDFL|nr:uncharacterized protein DUF1707 [Sediminitomix flava]